MKKEIIIISAILIGSAVGAYFLYFNNKNYLIKRVIKNSGLDDTSENFARMAAQYSKDELKAMLKE